MPTPGNGEALAQHLNRPMRFQRLGQPIHQHLERTITIVLLEFGPLSPWPEPSSQAIRSSAYNACSVSYWWFRQPSSLVPPVGNDVALEVLFMVCGVAPCGLPKVDLAGDGGGNEGSAAF